MDRYVDERDFNLLEKDRYTFSVLSRILRGKCGLILSDHEQLILCHSEDPFPVWIHTPDECPQEVMDRAWELACACRPLAEGYRYNLKYPLADRFLCRSEQAGIRARILTRLYAYDCPAPVKPKHTAEGRFHVCTPEDTEEATELLPLFYHAVGEELPARDYLSEKVRSQIREGLFCFWKDAQGRTAAFCSVRLSDGLATIGSVFTLPDRRRRHFAQNMVWQATVRAAEAGYMPCLYTDADYEASNACYTGIGYTLRGGLCTIGIK